MMAQHKWRQTMVNDKDGRLTDTGLVKSADLLTPSEPDAGSSAPDGNIEQGRQWGATCPRSDLVGGKALVGGTETAFTSPVTKITEGWLVRNRQTLFVRIVFFY